MQKKLAEDQSPQHQSPVLQKILDEAREFQGQGRPFLAVFDLDSTLFDLTLRVSSIIDRFASDPGFRATFPKECEALKSVQVLRTDWGLSEPLSRIGLTEENHLEFMQELQKYWAACFFSDDFLHHDEPLPGAVRFVCELRELGTHVMYLTGRDVPRMKKGTEASLRATGFPLGGREARLVLKPSAALNDAAFKVAVLKEAEGYYDKIWLFENEPVNLNLVAKHCPEIGLVFIESTHSGREEVAATLDRIHHFEISRTDFQE